MPKITLNNRSLHYRDEGQGPVVLFGHSYLWDSTMWRHQVAELSKKFRCIVPDLWGHGNSDNLHETPSIQSLADDFWQFVQALNIDHFRIVGLSIGGMWGTQLALDHPESVEKLVLMDTFVGVEPEKTKQHYFSLLDTVAQMGKVPSAMIAQLQSIFLSKDTCAQQPEIAKAFAEALERIPAEKIATIVALGRAIFSREDRLTRLHALKMPVLLMTGEFDMPRPHHEAQQMAALISKAECQIIAKAGHISALEQPLQVNAFLKQFL